MIPVISRRFIYLTTIFMVFVTIAACVKNERKNLLHFQVEGYHSAFRWREYQRASAYVANPREFLKKAEEYGDKLQVLDYEIVRYNVSSDGTMAEVEVIRTFNILPSVTVKRQRIVQKWKYDPQRKNWFLISPY